MIQFKYYIMGFDPTDPYLDASDHDYLDFSVQAGRILIGFQFYFLPVSLWRMNGCCLCIYKHWIKMNLPTLWFRANLSIFPKLNTRA